MSKRTAQSPLVKDESSKKLKVDTCVQLQHFTAASEASSPKSPLSNVAITREGFASPLITNISRNSLVKKSPTKKTPAKQAAPKKSATGAAPIADVFEAWTPPQPEIPDPSPHWGVVPTMRRLNNDENSRLVPDPLPHPDQPSARTSNGATNPPMWEDLGARFQRGSRYIKYTSVTVPDNADDLPETIDQEELLQIRLIDMRPKSTVDRNPRRVPMTYHYGDGQKDETGEKGKLGRKPKDWGNKQAIKCLNDRRTQAIGRITMDNAWTCQEREYLAELFEEFPNASIWEITARHNSRFLGEFMGGTGGLNYSYLSSGRTVESVRNQYMTYKPAYDRGKAPTGIRPSHNHSLEAKEAAQKWKGKVAKKFGSPDKKLEEAFDAAEETKPSKQEAETHQEIVKQTGDELLELAGYEDWYHSHQPTVHTPSQTSTPPTWDSPQPTATNQVAVIETKVKTEHQVIEEAVAEDQRFEHVTTQTVVETVTEAVESEQAAPMVEPERKRTASEVYIEKMQAISDDYDADDDYYDAEEEEEL
ncbi:hypothetical protein IAQ61_004015 [Plenodomus lingam]|uniref:Predicted protein n=1 Tax=Leptosphaeria maculans (strain JN3 / isolate v23.1.3 / race Av1-4-5-6-7-8) TaxID=985895 RepID=E4ZRE9_LEPMJ|nr:predicted protein [Plenodomus lingam JN3]KAH9874825.1 hypothetical protein IAQ61_004015 [Plenodomus lingam]CBX94143.1 predicted protein [Plenodomus lingam JN3]